MLFSIALYQRHIYIGTLYSNSNQRKLYVYTQCDPKITELFSYRIKQAWYYVSKLIFIQNRIHLTQYNVWNDQPIDP